MGQEFSCPFLKDYFGMGMNQINSYRCKKKDKDRYMTFFS